MSGELQMGLADALKLAPVVPVMVIEKLSDAVPMAKALVAGGLPVLEITLRTPVAPDAIRAIIAEVKGAIVGAGTVMTSEQIHLMNKLGCAFLVSPGYTKRLLDAASDVSVPLLPGAATASESMHLQERGYLLQKFFPAEPSGGTAYLSALSSPLPNVRFCPTGGITPESAPNYLKLKNVITVGGSWMLPKKLIEAGDWAGIEALARIASKLK
jgi:2-dehydro-3-deoxyphosphogluconate aldolase / (4S)-4-hydroxy-2-oxoglutarate aldolase